MPFSFPYLRAALGLLFVSSVAPAIAATDYNYDGGEALATLPGPHAISSYTKNGARHDLTYDRNGDLESISGSMNTSYTYNTLRKLKEATHSTGEVTRHFYTATGGRIATIRQSDSNLDVFAEGFLRFTNGNTRFTYGAIEENENGNNFVLKITDHLGSVIASADSTQVLNQRDYLPFGQEWISSAAFTDQNFNGHIKQGDLLDYNARHYLPELGKFIQMDSIIPKTDSVGFNRNAYVSNNPVNRVDPSGHGDVQGQIDAYENDPIRTGNFSVGTGNLPPLVAGLRTRVFDESLGGSGWAEVGYDGDLNPWLIPNSDPGTISAVGFDDDPGYFLLDLLGADGVPGPDKWLALKATLPIVARRRALLPARRIADDVVEANFKFLRSRRFLGAAEESPIYFDGAFVRRTDIYFDYDGRFLWAEPWWNLKNDFSGHLIDILPEKKIDDLVKLRDMDLGPPVASYGQLRMIEMMNVNGKGAYKPILGVYGNAGNAIPHLEARNIVESIERSMFPRR